MSDKFEEEDGGFKRQETDKETLELREFLKNY